MANIDTLRVPIDVFLMDFQDKFQVFFKIVKVLV